MKVYELNKQPTSEGDHSKLGKLSKTVHLNAGRLKQILAILSLVGFALVLWSVLSGGPSSSSNPTGFTPIQGTSSTGGEEVGVSTNPLPQVARRTSNASPALVVNYPPSVESIQLLPKIAYLGDEIEVAVEASDRDGDLITMDYAWFVNGTLHTQGRDPVFRDSATLKKHDQIWVRVTPSDGESNGIVQTSRMIQIVNRPPRILSSPSSQFENGIYSYRVEAQDEDGDQLNFSLSDHPSGMTIDPSSGLIQWEPPSEFSAVDVRVTASDGDGGEAFQQFRLFPRTSS